MKTLSTTTLGPWLGILGENKPAGNDGIPLAPVR